MATIFHPSTPPPPSSIHVPPTPKHGWEDDYQPYTPRKSARVSSQRARVAQTPPPPHYSSHSMKKTSSTNTTSPPSSPQTASKKKAPSAPNMMGERNTSGALNEESTVSAAEALGLSKAHRQRKMDSNQSSTVRRAGMLPTPAKTPKKQPSEISSGITSIARNLFPVRPETVEEVMPTPKRKGRKKYTGFSLDSFEAEDDGASIQIYTDSHERVPEVDRSSDNPFYGDASNAQPEPTKRASKRRKIPVPGEEDQTIEEAEKREDGLIYVFRGKKTFRKFVDDDDSGSDGDASADVGATLGTTVPERLRRPLTRSSIKPRLLFPTPEQSKAKEKRSQLTEDEEEAVTDIEEQADITSTPLDQTDEVIMTPKAPKFAPASPPTTARATRSTNKLESDDEHPPMRNSRTRGGKVSPFDGWSRTKTVSSQGKKREGDPLSRTGGESSKRLRS